MRTGARRCRVCARPRPVERHHVAGRGHLDALLIDVCRPCHDWLTGRQRDVGLLPYSATSTSPDDVTRAAAVGLVLVLEVLGYVHRRALHLDDRLMGRAVSQGLDLLAPPDRPGRWGPDSIGAALRPALPMPKPSPVSVDSQTEIGLAVVELVGGFVERFDPDPTMAERVGQLVAHVPQLVAAWEAAMADPALAERTQRLAVGIVDLLERAAHDIIASTDLGRLVEVYIPEFDATFDACRALLVEISTRGTGCS
jgi:hypothetical protein